MAPALNWLLFVRAAAVLCAIIELGLTAAVANTINSSLVVDFFGFVYKDHSPPQVNFLIFCSIFSLIVLALTILIPLFAERFAHKFAILAVDAVTTLFWFAGFIALAVVVGQADFGSCDGDSYCSTIEASVVFAAFLWILFLVLLITDVLHIFNTRKTKDTSAPPQMYNQSPYTNA